MPKSELPFPQVVIDLESWQRIHEFTRQCNVEINGFGLVDYDPTTNVIKVSDVFITRQTGSMIGVDVDDRDLHRHLYALQEEGIPINRVNFQWHSHINMDVYFSDRDKANIKRWAGDFLVSLVVNKRGEWRCRLDILKPVRIGQEVALQVGFPFGDEAMRLQVSRSITENLQILGPSKTLLPRLKNWGGSR